MPRIAISSGHGLYIRGASGNPVPPQLDEVDEARKVVDRVAQFLQTTDVGVETYHDNWSTTQSENLDRIVRWHNEQTRDLDVSVHFNAYDGNAHGTEVLYYSQQQLAAKVSLEICDVAGFINRGAKQRTDLAFLNGTDEPAILIETCFCDNTEDSTRYREHFDAICAAIAGAISGAEVEAPEPPRPQPPEGALFTASGPCSWFGGPDDSGVSSDEGLAFFYDADDAPHLFLPSQPAGTSGLARRLNPNLPYVACRWNYEVTPKAMLADPMRQALVRAGGRQAYAWPADWGPHEDTGRVADLSPALMDALGLDTDDVVEVIYPAPEES
jgi:N-acetylmuramoyl-L-alanine amidase